MKRLLSVFTAVVAFAALSFAQIPQPKPSAADVAELKRCQVAYAHAKAAYAKKPSAKTKQAYAVAATRYGTASMTTPVLDRKVKYRQALHLYKEALKLDPKNAEAKGNSKMIISIYKSMGRPVPQ